MTRYPYRADRQKQFVAAQREAREKKLGLWADTLPELPEPEGGVIGNRNSKVYRGPRCRSVAAMKDRNKASFANAQAAKAAGYRACKVCGGQ